MNLQNKQMPPAVIDELSFRRKLGNGYSLALNTGGGTHLTLVYFHSCKRGYEQRLVKQMSTTYMESLDVDRFQLILSGQDEN